MLRRQWTRVTGDCRVTVLAYQARWRATDQIPLRAVEAGQLDDGVTPVERVNPLVRSRGAELGVRISAVPGLVSDVAVWALDLDSELGFVGDSGGTEPAHWREVRQFLPCYAVARARCGCGPHPSAIVMHPTQTTSPIPSRWWSAQA